jgi:hypothetical protein
MRELGIDLCDREPQSLTRELADINALLAELDTN